MSLNLCNHWTLSHISTSVVMPKIWGNICTALKEWEIITITIEFVWNGCHM